MAMIVFMNQNYYVTKFRLWAKKEQKKTKIVSCFLGYGVLDKRLKAKILIGKLFHFWSLVFLKSHHFHCYICKGFAISDVLIGPIHYNFTTQTPCYICLKTP